MAFTPTQADIQTFNAVVIETMQQTRSKLQGLSAFEYVPDTKYIHNRAKTLYRDMRQYANGTDLQSTSNHEQVQYENRVFKKQNFERTVVIGNPEKFFKQINPEAVEIRQLVAAANRTIDKQLIQVGALGPVSLGDSDQAKTTITAAQDGVIPIDATTGFDYEVLTHAKAIARNNWALEDREINEFIFLATGVEEEALMNDERFSKSSFSDNRPSDTGRVANPLGMLFIPFAGTMQGVTLVPPTDQLVLPEDTGKRSCVLLAPRCVTWTMDFKDIHVEPRDNRYENAMTVRIDLSIGAMRNSGQGVIEIQTTV